jgi:hypothetical protein
VVTQSALLFLYVMYLSAAVTDLAIQPVRTWNFKTIKYLKQYLHFLVAVSTQVNTRWTGKDEVKKHALRKNEVCYAGTLHLAYVNHIILN